MLQGSMDNHYIARLAHPLAALVGNHPIQESYSFMGTHIDMFTQFANILLSKGKEMIIHFAEALTLAGLR